MKKERKKKKEKSGLGGIVICLFEIIVGILLLIDPIGFTTGIVTVAGIVLLLGGLFFTVKYFLSDVEAASAGQYLAKGLVAVLAGAFCAFNSDWFVVTFPMLTIVYGIVALVMGLYKVQLTVDMLRRKNKKWFISGIGALISIVCGAVILGSPFGTVAVLWTFTGVSMIVEAVVDIVAFIFGSIGKKKNEKPAEPSAKSDGQIIEAEAEEIVTDEKAEQAD